MTRPDIPRSAPSPKLWAEVMRLAGTVPANLQDLDDVHRAQYHHAIDCWWLTCEQHLLDFQLGRVP